MFWGKKRNAKDKKYAIIEEYHKATFAIGYNIYLSQQKLVVSVYLTSLPVAHLSEAPRGRLVVTGDSVRIQDETTDYLIIFVYLSSLPVAHMSDAPRRRLVVTGDSARIQDETTENSAWFFNVLGV